MVLRPLRPLSIVSASNNNPWFMQASRLSRENIFLVDIKENNPEKEGKVKELHSIACKPKNKDQWMV